MLKQGVNNLARGFGQLLLPVLEKIYPVLNGLVMVAQEFVTWLAKIFGIKLGDFDTSIDVPDMSDTVDDADDLADATGKTAKNTKKIADNIQKFDVLNRLEKIDNTEPSGSSGKGGKGAGSPINLDSDIQNALDKYKKMWENMFKSTENRATVFANRMKKALIEGWASKDFSSLGRKLADWVNKGIKNAPMSKIKDTMQGIAKSIATFLNGFVDKLDFKQLGKFIADWINSGINFSYTFYSTFDFLKFGTKIAEGINSAVKNFDATKFGNTLGLKLRAGVQFAFGLITNINFDKIGKKISNVINGFFAKMNAVDTRTGLSGWQEMGKSITKIITGLTDTITTALLNIETSEIGNAIADLFGSIGWVKIFLGVGKVIATALFTAIKTALFSFANDPLGFSETLLVIMGGWFVAKNFKTIGKNISNYFIKAFTMREAGARCGSQFISSIKGSFASVNWKSVLKVGAYAGAIAVITGETKVLIDEIKTYIDAVNGTGEFAYNPVIWGDTQRKIDDTKKKLAGIDTAIATTRNTVKDYNKAMDNAVSVDGQPIDDLANRWEKLSKKTKPTANDIATMKSMSKKLVGVLPELKGHIDKETGAFKGQSSTLKNLIRDYKKALKQKVALSKAEDIYNQKIDTRASLKDAEKIEKEAYANFKEGKKRIDELNKQGVSKDDVRYKDALYNLSQLSATYNDASYKAQQLRDEYKDLTKAEKRNNNILNYSKTSTRNVNKESKKLKDTLKDLGVSSKEQKTAMKILNEALDDGTISWKDYKSICDKSYKSTDDLRNAIDKASGGTVKINVQGKDDLKKAKDNADSLKDKTVNIDVNGNTSGATEVKKAVDGVPNKKNVNVFANANTGGITTFNNMLGKIPNSKNTTLNAVVSDESKKKIRNDLDKIFGNPFNIKVKSDNKNGYAGFKALKVVLPDMANKTWLVPKENTSFKSKNGWKIQRYAKGGFPSGEDGLFYANHNEMIGKFSNGKTAVANNDQITTGITQAVAPAVYTAVKSALSEINFNSGGDIYLDGEKITTNIAKHSKSISKRTGRPVFAT